MDIWVISKNIWFIPKIVCINEVKLCFSYSFETKFFPIELIFEVASFVRGWKNI